MFCPKSRPVRHAGFLVLNDHFQVIDTGVKLVSSARKITQERFAIVWSYLLAQPADGGTSTMN